MPVLLALSALSLLGGGSFLVMVVRRLDRSQRRRLLGWAGAAFGLLATVALVARFGIGGLAPAAIAVVSAGRRLTSLAAGLPLLARLGRMFFQGRGSGAPGVGGGSAAGASRAASPRRGRMSRQEALKVLGLDEGASPQEVHKEYRRLIKRLHPDQGGSSYLAAQVNEAYDVLLA